MFTSKTPVDAALQLNTFTSTVGINYPLKSAKFFVIKTPADAMIAANRSDQAFQNSYFD